MVKLLIIADDFTGALDTGVKLSQSGISTKVIVDNRLEIEDYDVLVIDAETRHLPADQAYEIVYGIVEKAAASGIRCIYKKTDSALRGNIGAELTAALKASGEHRMFFVPAFPKMNRVTKNGIHYIGEDPVSKSVFGIDPFEPVTKDSVKEIIADQSDVAVLEAAPETVLGGKLTAENDDVVVVDASTEQELKNLAEWVRKEEKCTLLAGCAGFAAYLTEILELQGQKKEEPVLPKKLMMVCGSVNPITKSQVAYAVTKGYAKFALEPEQKLDASWWNKEESKAFLQTVHEKLVACGCAIVDSNDPEDNKTATMDYAGEHGMTLEDVRATIAGTMGVITDKLVAMEDDTLFLVTGGDTLLGLMKVVGCNSLVPIREIAPGCVLTQLNLNGKSYYIITKSGGFGAETLLEDIMKEIN